MVLSALSHKVTNKFKSFCKTELMDRFLYACIEYFTVFFELQARPASDRGLPRSKCCCSPARLSPPQKHLSDASEEVAKKEQLYAFAERKVKDPSSPHKPPAQPEDNDDAVLAEEEVSTNHPIAPTYTHTLAHVRALTFTPNLHSL